VEAGEDRAEKSEEGPDEAELDILDDLEPRKPAKRARVDAAEDAGNEGLDVPPAAGGGAALQSGVPAEVEAAEEDSEGPAG